MRILVRMIILGSQSARRKEILDFFALPFKQIGSGFDEGQILYKKNPLDYVKTLSAAKASCLADHYSDQLILTADTIVHRKGEVFEKPTSDKEAIAMLKTLSGKWHEVFTSVTLQKNAIQWTEVQTTRVLFHRLSNEQITRYHAVFQNHDKAGGYAIQQAGSIIVKEIEGCFYNVMGLGINALATTLQKFEIDLWDYLKQQ